MKQLYPPSEVFLQYVWKWQYFSHKHLQTTDNKPITIISQGQWNRDQGPDFLNACVEIEGLRLFGHIEIHLDSQDWYRHKHESDPFYNGTILHVVFSSNGAKIMRMDGSFVPELIIGDRLDATLCQKYDRLRLSEEQIPCFYFLEKVSQATKSSFLTALGEERIRRKAVSMKALLAKNKQNWRQILWRQLAQSLGGKVNGMAIATMAERVDASWLSMYQRNPLQLEALLFGLAGLMESVSEDSYHQALKVEWDFLKRKHQIPVYIPIPLKYLRMHPASFPTIRISQLAKLIGTYPRLEELMNPHSWPAFLKEEIKASPYWERHNRFGEPKESSHPKRLGRHQKEVMLINVLAPLALLYLEEHGRSHSWEEILGQLASLSPENNRITRKWKEMGFPNDDPLHSQGILRLSRHYCQEKRCLECEIGQRIIKP